MTPNLEDDTMKAPYEASLNGSKSTLNTLNPLSLSRISLHKATLLGQLEFCEVLLDIKPNLATEVDSEGRCPLHLASAEGHTEVVKALLMTNSDVCFTPDKDGKLPIHLAASRGHIGAIEELIINKPESIVKMTNDGSVLHLCVMYNHFEALKLLVQSVGGTQQQLLHAKDNEGNTIL